MPLTTFRDTLREKCPPWLRQGTAEKVLYSIGVLIDGFADALTAGLKMRFPGYYSAESLPHIGRERRIRRGRNESDAVYAPRLIRWLADHQRRGGPYALLAQLHAHFADAPFAIELLYYPSALLGTALLWDSPPGIWNDGGVWSATADATHVARRYSMDTAGNVLRGEAAWTPDSDSAHWARWWLIYSWPGAVVLDGAWDDAGVWSDGGVWDLDGFDADEVAELRAIPREWNAQHARGHLVLAPADAELWDYPPGIWNDGGAWNDETTTAVTIRV